MKHSLISLGPLVHVGEQDAPQFKAMVMTDAETKGWLARLIPGRPGNRLNVFYHREYLEPALTSSVAKTFWLEDGIYEAEHQGQGSPYRTVFCVKDSQMTWVSSVTLSKRITMKKVAEALSPLEAR